MKPLPQQITGSEFLAARNTALLADAPRVGKTGSAILAADKAPNIKRILVITTASGRPVWSRAWRDWSLGRSVATHYKGPWTAELESADVAIVGWSMLGRVREVVGWDLIIADESHYAKSPETQRTRMLFGNVQRASRTWGLCDMAERVWCLTGTPIPNAPNDLFAMLKALAPDRLTTTHGPVDVSRYDDFLHRYCRVRPKRVGWNRTIQIVMGGRNEAELHDRMKGFYLRRTQQDVGITAPLFDLLPLHVSPRARAEIDAQFPEAAEVLAGIEAGEDDDDMHLGTLRRLTGIPKAKAVAELVREEMASGLDKVVLMCWHKDVMNVLANELSSLGVERVDGSTAPQHREKAVESFNGEARVFIGQIVACGEAVDLSAAAELIFVESSFVPKDMTQAALRITNVNQNRQPRVRVAALEGSIDEAVQAVVVRKVSTNKEVIK